ncbi:MAG: hypothetical protein ACFFFT_15900 [Candidatus Thorarchaeota archaeon]
MGNGKGLTIFTLLISLIAVSLGVYTFVDEVLIPTSQTSSKIENVYYSERPVSWYPTSLYTEVISIDVVVKQGQNLYMFFESEVILRNSGSYEEIHIRLTYNGIQITSSDRTAADVPAVATTRQTLTTQDNLLNLTADTYTISVESYGEGTLGYPGGNRIEKCSLVIMVYN